MQNVLRGRDMRRLLSWRDVPERKGLFGVQRGLHRTWRPKSVHWRRYTSWTGRLLVMSAWNVYCQEPAGKFAVGFSFKFLRRWRVIGAVCHISATPKTWAPVQPCTCTNRLRSHARAQHIDTIQNVSLLPLLIFRLFSGESWSMERQHIDHVQDSIGTGSSRAVLTYCMTMYM